MHACGGGAEGCCCWLGQTGGAAWRETSGDVTGIGGAAAGGFT